MNGSSGQSFMRVQVRYRGRLGVEVGVIVAVDHLRRAGLLHEHELSLYLDVDDWLQENLPNPPFYKDGNSIGAVTWFKAPLPETLREKMESLRGILRAHGVEHDAVTSEDPGEVIYEDDWQVGVLPRHREDPTPMPEGLVMGPTASGSMRKFLESNGR